MEPNTPKRCGQRNRGKLFLILFLMTLILAGCGRDHVGFHGKVIFSDDKSPLTVGIVCFATPTFQAKGDLRNDGSFSVGSYNATDGLPPGTYQVGIIAATEDLGDEISYSLVDPKWNSPKTSGFTIDITETTRRFEIQVERNPETREETLKRSKTEKKNQRTANK